MTRICSIAFAVCAALGCGPTQPDVSTQPAGTESAERFGQLSAAEAEQLRQCARGLEAAPNASAELRVLLLAEACWPACKGLASVGESERATVLSKNCGYNPGSSTPPDQYVAVRANDWIKSLRVRGAKSHKDLVAQVDRAIGKVRIPLPAPSVGVPEARYTRERRDTELALWIALTMTEARIVERSYVQLSIDGAKIAGNPDGEVVSLSALGVEHTRRQHDVETSARADDERGGTGTKMALDEGKMGRKDSTRQSGRYRMKKNDTDPQLAKERAIEQARAHGILGVLTSGRSVGPSAPVIAPDSAITTHRVRAVLEVFSGDGIRLAARRDGQLVVHKAGLTRYTGEISPVLIVEPSRLRIAHMDHPTVDIANTKDGRDWSTARKNLKSDWQPALLLEDDVPVGVLYEVLDFFAAEAITDVTWIDASLVLGWVDTPVSERVTPGGFGVIGSGSGSGTGYGIGSGKGGMRGTKANQPVVRIGSATATGDLDKNIIRRYIRRKLPKIRYCYERQLLVEPKLAGKVTVNFQISSTGAVKKATASGLHKIVDACVARTIKSIKFPKPKGGGIVTVRYPFTFKSK